MSSVRGLLKTCDRCGAVKFCKYTGTDVFDGGFIQYDKFEKAEGWSCEAGIGHMCKKCTSEYRDVIARFVRNAQFADRESVEEE